MSLQTGPVSANCSPAFSTNTDLTSHPIPKLLAPKEQTETDGPFAEIFACINGLGRDGKPLNARYVGRNTYHSRQGGFGVGGWLCSQF
jgi:hypothetical protein